MYENINSQHDNENAECHIIYPPDPLHSQLIRLIHRHNNNNNNNNNNTNNLDLLCGLVVRVLGYRSGGPDTIPGTTRKKSAGPGKWSTQPREYN
jgi:hypothetical protein